VSGMDELLDRLLALWIEPVAQRPDAVARFAEVYADPVTVNGVAMPLGALVERARGVRRTYAGLTMDEVHRMADGDRLAVAFVMVGRHVGPLATPFGEVAPTGRDVRIRVTDILTVADGRVVDIWMIADELDLLRQLGVPVRLG
jgi:predicted ester cyclase